MFLFPRWIAGQGELTSTGTDGLAFIKSKYNGYVQSGSEVGTEFGVQPKPGLGSDGDFVFGDGDNRIRKRENG